MSVGFELQPQDGGPRVALAPGETVIGRGPLLGVSVEGDSLDTAILQGPWVRGPSFEPGSISHQLVLPVWILEVWGSAFYSQL